MALYSKQWLCLSILLVCQYQQMQRLQCWQPIKWLECQWQRNAGLSAVESLPAQTARGGRERVEGNERGRSIGGGFAANILSKSRRLLSELFSRGECQRRSKRKADWQIFAPIPKYHTFTSARLSSFTKHLRSNVPALSNKLEPLIYTHRRQKIIDQRLVIYIFMVFELTFC